MDRDKIAEMITRYEEKRYAVYPDSLGILTVGIGCNLETSTAPMRIAALGVDYAKLCSGKCELTEDHVMALFSDDLDDAVAAAQSMVPNFDEHPDDVQHVIIDMIFNMGETRFAKFKKLIAALKIKDYGATAAEMSNSKWAGQVGRRAQEDIALVLKYAA